MKDGKPYLRHAFHFLNRFMFKGLNVMVAQTVIENDEGHGLLTKELYNQMAQVHQEIFPNKPFPLRISKQVCLIFNSFEFKKRKKYIIGLEGFAKTAPV